MSSLSMTSLKFHTHLGTAHAMTPSTKYQIGQDLKQQRTAPFFSINRFEQQHQSLHQQQQQQHLSIDSSTSLLSARSYNQSKTLVPQQGYSKIHDAHSRLLLRAGEKDSKHGSSTHDSVGVLDSNYHSKLKTISTGTRSSAMLSSQNRTEIKQNQPAGVATATTTSGTAVATGKKTPPSPLLYSTQFRTTTGNFNLPKIESLYQPTYSLQQLQTDSTQTATPASMTTSSTLKTSEEQMRQSSYKTLKSSPQQPQGFLQSPQTVIPSKTSAAVAAAPDTASTPSQEEIEEFQSPLFQSQSQIKSPASSLAYLPSPELLSSASTNTTFNSPPVFARKFSARKKQPSQHNIAVASPQSQQSESTPNQNALNLPQSHKLAIGVSPRFNILKFSQQPQQQQQQQQPTSARQINSTPLKGAQNESTQEQKVPQSQKSNYPTRLIRPLAQHSNENKTDSSADILQKQQQPSLKQVDNSNPSSQSTTTPTATSSKQDSASTISTPPSTSQQLVSPNSTIQPQSPPTNEQLQPTQLQSEAKQQPASRVQSAAPSQAANSMNSNTGKIKIKYPITQTVMKTRAGQHSQFARKENQDSSISLSNFLCNPACHLYGVYDGHGQNGEHASDFVKRGIIRNLTNEIKNQGGLENEEIDLPTCLRRAYLITNKELLLQSNFDVTMSGCTAVTVLTFRQDVFCANAGDSRAMIARHTNKGEWKHVELSKDHKPECPEEKNRILAAGGRVQQSLNQYGQPVGIYRVWKKQIDLPGLAMTRSMGDTYGRECGVIADPEIIKHTLTEEDKIMIIASDGVWEFLTNSDVARLVAPFFQEGKLKDSADALVARSVREWQKEGDSVDDITCVIVHYTSMKETTI